MFARRQAKPDGRVDTLVGSGSRIDGDIRFTGGLRIDGTVSGNIVSQDSGTLVLSEEGIVEGEIRVAHAVINGKVSGPIHASENVELQSRARVCGDVHYGTLEVHLGAIVQGRLVPGTEALGSENVVSLKSSTVD
jgi:cytoskeletal protein CcmA (bactofilin family)